MRMGKTKVKKHWSFWGGIAVISALVLLLVFGALFAYLDAKYR
jgi:hypothetical protein